MVCIDHLSFCEQKCPDCGLYVDGYGNTEGQFQYCSFPDCGCDGSRLCMATNGASENSETYNVEGMYSMKGTKGQKARLQFLAFIHKDQQP